MTNLRRLNVPQTGTGKVVVSHLHPGEVSASFSHSLLGTYAHDNNGRLVSLDGRLGVQPTMSGAGRLAGSRNMAVANFLDTTDGEWLWMIDSDMGWDETALEQLLAVADADSLPVVGGLCFGARFQGEGPAHSARVHYFPTLYRWDDQTGVFSLVFDWDRGTVVKVDGTGAAFLLVHRRVLEDLRREHGDRWFDNIPIDNGTPDLFGEDLSFCVRLRQAGIPVHVHTGVKVSHRKAVWIDESAYDQQRATSSSAVVVVIPVKDGYELTKRTVAALYEAGGYDDLLIFDNGTTDPEMVAWLQTLADAGLASVFDAPDAGIHDMWNAGIEEAIARHGGLADVVFLNNDLDLGPGFLQRLTAGLRSDKRYAAVCGNYDGRPGHGTIPIEGICAGRYDGTGGMAGFAFAVKAEWLASYRFPAELAWFFGDNHLVGSIAAAGGLVGLVTDAPVVHVGGGGQTTTAGAGPTAGAGWFESLSPRMRQAYKADEATFAQMCSEPAEEAA